MSSFSTSAPSLPRPGGEFGGRRIVVTGASSGIGEACAAHFAALGAEVFNLDLRPSDSPSVTHMRTDVTSQESVDAAIASVVAAAGGLDVVVNNAGVSFVGGVEDGTEAEWDRLWDINLMGYVRVLRAALPHLREGVAPSIVHLSSTTATSGFRQRAAYSAAKGAVESMTRAIAADLVGEGITVNAVNPGTVDTPFMAELAARAEDPAARRADFESRQPTGRMVDPAEVARAVAYFADPRNRSSVGATLMVDGGIFNLHLTRA